MRFEVREEGKRLVRPGNTKGDNKRSKGGRGITWKVSWFVKQTKRIAKKRKGESSVDLFPRLEGNSCCCLVGIAFVGNRATTRFMARSGSPKKGKYAGKHYVGFFEGKNGSSANEKASADLFT